MSATATRCSPWHDALRHRYEDGSTVSDLAYWFSTSKAQMCRYLELAGTKFRHRQGAKALARRRKDFEEDTAEARAVVFSERAGIF